MPLMPCVRYCAHLLAFSPLACARQPHALVADCAGRPPSHISQVALNLWSEMEADGLRPNAPICHKMFGIWMQEGMADKAEEVFSEMKSNSAKLQATGRDLAEKWLGGDLDAVKLVLENTPLALQTMCHTSSTYVKLIDACVFPTHRTHILKSLAASRSPLPTRIFMGIQVHSVARRHGAVAQVHCRTRFDACDAASVWVAVRGRREGHFARPRLDHPNRA